MNRNRNRISKPVEDTPELLIDRVDKLSSRIKQCNHLDGITIAHVRSLLQTVCYLMENSGPDEIADNEDSDDDDDEDDAATIHARKSQLRSRKQPISLRERWAGDLPSTAPDPPKLSPKQELERQRRVAAMTVNGMSGGHPDLYEQTYDIPPNANCSGCDGPVIAHAWDRNLKDQVTQSGITLRAKILCDTTRAWIPVGNLNEA